MIIRFDRNEMLNSIAPCMGFVSSKNTISAIEGLHLVADSARGLVTLCAYDLEKGIRLEVDATIIEDGDHIISATKFQNILKLMPAGEIELRISAQNIATIAGGKSEFEIHTQDGKDFPALPELSGEKGFAVVQKVLKKLVNQVSFGIAVNDARPALNSAYFMLHGNHIRVVACDGNRLAIKEADSLIENHNQNGDDINFEFMIPGKSLAEIMRLIEDKEEMIKIVFGRKHIIFHNGKTKFFARMTDGEYIDYNRFIPSSQPIKATVDCDAFIGALERASLITEEKIMNQTRSVVKLYFDGELLKVNSHSVAGRMYDEIPIAQEGDEIELGFNCRLLLESMRCCDVGMVDIGLTSPQMGIVVTPHEKEDGENFLFLILPVKVRD